MTIDILERVAFLKKLSLFYGLDDDKLEFIAEKFREQSYTVGSVVYRQDSKSEDFYVIYKGKVRIVHKPEGQETQLEILEDKDYFGETGLIARKRRSGSVTAAGDTTLLVLARKDFEDLFGKSSQLRANLDVAVQSRRLARKQKFKWLRRDEVIYFIARKHPINMYLKLILPMLSLSLPLIIIYAYFAMAPLFIISFVGISSMLAALGWIAWTVVDWGNDYYIVTNSRAVWLEKVVAIYDSRQESPLSMILSVRVETSQLGRIFDYGDVIIRTYVGHITFTAVHHPEQARHIIEEYWNRTKEQAAGIEKDAIKNSIRKQLGLPIPAQPKPDLPPPASPPPLPKNTRAALRLLGSNTLALRYETGDSVIYHKHWVVLFLGAWIPFTIAIALLVFFFIRLFQILIDPQLRLFAFQNGFSMETWASVFLTTFALFSLWVIYAIADWINDKYEVTDDQIIDTNRKPFGTESRKTAQLENILGTSYERRGLLGNIFNYGTVYIMVGSSHLNFEGVLDPATVQSDINRRRMADLEKQAQAKTNAERERMAGWLATYHKNAQGFYDEEKNNNQNTE